MPHQHRHVGGGDGTDYFTQSSIFNNLSFDKVFPVHPNVDMQYRLQKVIRGYFAYRCLFIAQCVRRAVRHPTIAKKRNLIGFIGCGAFAAGILDGLLQTGVDPETIVISSRRPEIYGKYRRLGVACVEDNGLVLRKSRIVFLACLPSQLRTALAGMRGQLKKTTLVVSILAGVRILTIRNMLDAADEQFLRVTFVADTMYDTIADLAAEYKTEWRNDRIRKFEAVAIARAQSGDANNSSDDERDDVHQPSSQKQQEQASQAIHFSADDFFRHDAQSNVCKSLVNWSLTNDRRGSCAHDGLYSIVNAIEFMLTRLGCGAVAHRIAVESVVGTRPETDLQKQIHIETEELKYREQTYEENEPQKRKERQAAQKDIRQRRREIARLQELERADFSSYLARCVDVYDREYHQDNAQVPDTASNGDEPAGSSGADNTSPSSGGSSKDGIPETGQGDAPKAAFARTDSDTSAVVSPSDMTMQGPDEQGSSPTDLSSYIRASFEATCAKFVPQRVVTFMDVVPDDEFDLTNEHADLSGGGSNDDEDSVYSR